MVDEWLANGSLMVCGLLLVSVSGSGSWFLVANNLMVWLLMVNRIVHRGSCWLGMPWLISESDTETTSFFGDKHW